MNGASADITLVSYPSNLRRYITKLKRETNLTRTDFEVLTTLYVLCKTEAYIRRPKDIYKRLPTLSRDYFYKYLKKIINNGYAEQINNSVRDDNSGQFRSGLYGITLKGNNLVKAFAKEMAIMGERVLYGYI